MKLFRIYLVITFIALTIYTFWVGNKYGWNLLPIFFSNISEMTWHGQFNFDFMTFLGLSAIWVIWRHQFSLVGIILGIIALFGGMMFLAPYIFYASVKAKGDIVKLLLGKEYSNN